MVKVEEYFEVIYGVNLELNALELDEGGVNFVGRGSQNNGVVARVASLFEIEPNPANTISVAGGGSVMETFLQEKPYYSGRDLYYLKPKIKMTTKQLLFYCTCLRANKFRYNYGRQANKTLHTIRVPSLGEIPDYVKSSRIPAMPSKKPVIAKQTTLETDKWKHFVYEEIFDVLDGFYNLKPDATEAGDIPLIGASEFNNGSTSFHDIETIELSTKDGKNKNHDISKKIFKGGEHITISNDGSVGHVFYQPLDFTCSHSVAPVKLKNAKMNKYIAMFLCSVIGIERYRWNYGRKWRPIKMRKSKIKLPVDINGNPDWQFMENYIKTLPYSSGL